MTPITAFWLAVFGYMLIAISAESTGGVLMITTALHLRKRS